MNGADDVVKYGKFAWSGPHSRFITMGRPGYTEKVAQGMADNRVDPDAGYFILGPELPDISSTQARLGLAAGDRKALEPLLHPRVTEWCLSHEPYGGPQMSKVAAVTPDLGI